MHATAAQVETICAAYRRTRVDPSEPPADLRRFMRRATTPSGMVRIELQLPPEQANVIWAAMNAALDAGRSEADSAAAPGETGSPNAEAEEAPGDAGTRAANDASAEARPLDPTVTPAERASAMVSVAQSFLDHPHRTLGSGYELVMMTSPAQLEHGPGGVGGFLRDGTPVPQHIARMLACDCARVDVQASESGEVLDVGRSRRTIPNAIARALWIRDGGCRVPGCGRKHHLHAHHLEAWAEGGPTKLSNLALLCPYHHLLVHEGQLRVELREGKLEFRNVHGLTLKPAPDRGSNEELEAVTRWLNAIEPDLDGDNHPKWDGSRLDLDAVLSWMFAAEARVAA